MACCGGRRNLVGLAIKPRPPVRQPTVKPIPVRRRQGVRPVHNNPIDRYRDQ